MKNSSFINFYFFLLLIFGIAFLIMGLDLKEGLLIVASAIFICTSSLIAVLGCLFCEDKEEK